MIHLTPRVLVMAFAISSILSSAALGQIATPSPNAAARGGVQSQYTPEQRQQFGADRRACNAELKPKELPRGERAKAMRSCMEGKNPAYKVAFDRSGQRRADMKQIRQDCRAGMGGKKLSKDERRASMQTCIVAKRPEMAKQFACADQAKQKGLQAGTERRTFMRECRRS
jgi:hypothetical protein